MAGHPLQSQGGVHQFLYGGIAVIHLPELPNLQEGLRYAHGMGCAGQQASYPVCIAIGPAQGSPHISNDGLGSQGAEGDDLSHVVVAVFLGYIADDFFPTIVLEVQVYVRWFFSLHVEETFEYQVISQGVDVGDIQAVQDETGGGAAPYSTEDAIPPGVAYDVPNDQEIVGEIGLAYYIQFIGEASLYLVGHLGVAALESSPAELRQIFIGTLTLRHRVLGEAKTIELQL